MSRILLIISIVAFSGSQLVGDVTIQEFRPMFRSSFQSGEIDGEIEAKELISPGDWNVRLKFGSKMNLSPDEVFDLLFKVLDAFLRKQPSKHVIVEFPQSERNRFCKYISDHFDNVMKVDEVLADRKKGRATFFL